MIDHPLHLTENFAHLDGTSHDLDALANSVAVDNWQPLVSFLQEWYNDSPYVTVHTSGSTGEPKAIRVSKEQMANSARMTAEFLVLAKGTEAFLPLSVEYIAGKMMVVRALVNRWKLTIAKPPADPMVGISSNHDLKFTALVPYQLSQILRSEDSLAKLDRFDTIIVGGAPISKELEKQLQDLSPAIYQTYGMTETVSHIAMRRVNGLNASEAYTTIGRTTVNTDNEGRLTIDAPDIGVIELQTNDLAKLIDNKQFIWLGRYDNVINSGGVKLIPEQLEQKLSILFPSKRYFLSSLPHRHLGEQLILVIETSELPGDIRNAINQVLQGYEKPKQILLTTAFVETASGKIQRKKSLAVALSSIE